MEQTLKAAVRESTGKGVARQLRAQNRVPAVLYGAGVDPTPLSVDARELFRTLHTDAGTNVLIDLDVEGQGTHLALAREIQQDHIKNRTVHVDFLAVRRDQTITVQVPLEITGASAGVHEGGVMEQHLYDIEIDCLPGNVPGHVEVDVTNLGIGDSLHVSDITPPEGTEIKSDAEVLVVAIVTAQQGSIEDEAEAAEAVEGEEGAEGEGSADASAEEGGGE